VRIAEEGCSTRTCVDSGKYRGLVRSCGAMEWAAGLLYVPEVMRRLTGDRASDTWQRRILHGGIRRLLDDGLRDLVVRVTALVQRAACECSDTWRCCELPANALALPLDIWVMELRQNIYSLLKSTPLSLYARCLCLDIRQPMHIECISALFLLHYCFTCLYKCLSPALLLLYSYFTYIYACAYTPALLLHF
jgi:hypothetical protein